MSIDKSIKGECQTEQCQREMEKFYNLTLDLSLACSVGNIL